MYRDIYPYNVELKMKQFPRYPLTLLVWYIIYVFLWYAFN